MTKFGLIGYPIAHSLSPELFRKAYNGRWDYDLLEYEDFDIAWRIFLEGPYRAVNITAPFKARAAAACGHRSEEVLACGAANIAVKRDDGLYAFNSDVLALRHMLASSSPAETAQLLYPTTISHTPSADVAVIGSGGAGQAALAAARSLGLPCRLYHHEQLAGGPICARTIVFTLPEAAPGLENLHCDYLIEANYKNPCCTALPDTGHYIPGTEWLRLQARLGYSLMTGTPPDNI